MRSRIHIRLWLLLVTAFLLVGGCATYAILSVTVDRVENDARVELIGVAKLLALQFDAERVRAASRDDVSELSALNSSLETSRQQAASVRRIFLIRKGSGNFTTILDSSASFKNGMPNSLFKANPGISRTAKDVFESGVPAVEDEVVTDKWGSYFTAYAPLIDRTGHAVAVVGVDRDATRMNSHVKSVRRLAWLAMITVLLLGSIFSMIIIRQLATGAKAEPWLRSATSSNKVFRATVLELTLAGLACGVIVMGVYAQVRLSQLRSDEQNSLSRVAPLDQFRNRIDRVLKDDRVDPSTLDLLAQWSQSEGLQWLATSLNASINANQEEWREPLWQALTVIKRKSEQEQRLRTSLKQEMNDVGENLTRTFVLAILLSFGSLVIVRSAANQQQQLLIARHDSQRHQVAYEQVASNLPIGFYTYRDGEIEDANVAWDEQVTRLPGESRMMALERAVHEDDLPTLQSALAGAETSGGFNLHFRLRASSSEVRHFETRGVWVRSPEEGIDNLLGFFVDITDLVRNRDELEVRNGEIQGKNLMLTKALSDLENNLEAMVHGLVKAVEAKDPYTAGHSERVMQYSVKIGEVLALTPHELRTLMRGTLIHDVGKIGIPDDVLMKPAKLTEEEFKVIQQHPTIGANMISGIPVFDDCLPIVRSHHERLDGRGYPDGLKGDDISLLVRIASVADVFDALTSTRAYRAAMDNDQAIAILRKDAAAGILDEKIVEILADIVKRDGVLWDQPSAKAA